MGEWLNIIITCLVAPAVYEILKISVIWIIEKFRENSLPYSMSGYWCTYHEAKDKKDGKIYSTYELVSMKQHNSRLTFCLYQFTNDGRFCNYKGVGYIRGTKVSLAYEECDRRISSNTGTITILRQDYYQHTPKFKGIYSEFVREQQSCTSRPYVLYYLEMEVYDRIMLRLFKSKYAKRYMQKERFLKKYEKSVQ